MNFRRRISVLQSSGNPFGRSAGVLIDENHERQPSEQAVPIGSQPLNPIPGAELAERFGIQKAVGQQHGGVQSVAAAPLAIAQIENDRVNASGAELLFPSS